MTPLPDENDHSLRVLIVDDTPEIRFLIEIVLSNEPNVRLVGEAEDGRQALEKVDLLKPDLVVMDLQMPVMDGLTATRAITALGRPLEVVGFTSADQAQSDDEMKKAGAVASFDKTDLEPLFDFIRSRAATASSISLSEPTRSAT